MKTFRKLTEDQWDDYKKKIETKGVVYEVVANIIMLSKWGGIRKTVAPYIKVCEEGKKVYMMKYDKKTKKVANKATMETTDLNTWKKIISNKEVKKV